MNTAAIYNWTTGDELTVGLEPCTRSDQALRAAQRLASERGEPVHLVDADGEWRVDPDDGSCERLR